jgi:hypothetical protein
MTVKLSSPLQITKLSTELDGDGYPYEAIILSGEPIDQWYGRFVVDLQTVKYHKPRLSVNYNHNPELIIGYGENFQVTPDGLKTTGKLVAGTFADEIVKLAKQGVPFEASVEIDLGNAVEARVGADSTAVCNDRTYSGPISIYSQVPLLAYAVCQCGADKHTTLTLLTKELEFMPKTKVTPKQTTKLSDEEKDKDEELKTVKSQELADFCSMFGDANGLALFQSGADIAEAKQWQSLNEKYSQYLSDDKDDEPTPPEPDPNPEPDEDDKDKLSAVLTKLEKLTKAFETQSAEIANLKASAPRGADPVSMSREEPPQREEKKNSVSAAARRYKERGVKE